MNQSQERTKRQMPKMNENENAVLRQAALVEGFDPSTLSISDDVVFRLDGESVAGTVCQIDTPYWNNAVQSCTW